MPTETRLINFRMQPIWEIGLRGVGVHNQCSVRPRSQNTKITLSGLLSINLKTTMEGCYPRNNTLHRFIAVSEDEKREKLLSILKEQQDGRTFVHAPYVFDSVFLGEFLSRQGLPVIYVEHNSTWISQQKQFVRFQLCPNTILIFDDVFQIWGDKIKHVINYTKPNELSTYLRSVELTGRSPHRGIVTTFLDNEDDDVQGYADFIASGCGVTAYPLQGVYEKLRQPPGCCSRKSVRKRRAVNDATFYFNFPTRTVEPSLDDWFVERMEPFLRECRKT